MQMVNIIPIVYLTDPAKYLYIPLMTSDWVHQILGFICVLLSASLSDIIIYNKLSLSAHHLPFPFLSLPSPCPGDLPSCVQTLPRLQGGTSRPRGRSQSGASELVVLCWELSLHYYYCYTESLLCSLLPPPPDQTPELWNY